MSVTKIRGVSTREMFRRLRALYEAKFDSKEKVIVAGTSRTASALASTFAEAEAHYVRVDQHRANLHQGVQEREGMLASVAPLAQACITSLEVHWGNSPDKLSEAGIPPKKAKRALSSQELFAASVKRKKTRELRNTKGKRQKAKIKALGQVNVLSELVSTHGPSASSAGAANGVSPSPVATSNGAVSNGHANQLVPQQNGANPITGEAV